MENEMTLDALIAQLQELRAEIPGTTPVLVATFEHEDPQPVRQATWQTGTKPFPTLHVIITG